MNCKINVWLGGEGGLWAVIVGRLTCRGPGCVSDWRSLRPRAGWLAYWRRPGAVRGILLRPHVDTDSPPLRDSLPGSVDGLISWSEADRQRGPRRSLPGSRRPARQRWGDMTWRPGGQTPAGARGASGRPSRSSTARTGRGESPCHGAACRSLAPSCPPPARWWYSAGGSRPACSCWCSPPRSRSWCSPFRTRTDTPPPTTDSSQSFYSLITIYT